VTEWSGKLADLFTISVPADAANLRCIRGFIAPILEASFDPDSVGQLVLAVDEACSNIIKHAQKWFKRKGTIQVEVRDGRRSVEIRVRNYCREKDVENIHPRDLDEVRPGGLGTHFIAEIMDRMEIVPDPDGGKRMALVMEKAKGE
jgi:sigma-B regulation protein RsbU (phosphoserine phosphatase)